MAACAGSIGLLPVLCTVLLAACETAPVGPGQTINAAQSSILFNHPRYPNAGGEFTQRSGGYNSQTETAFFTGSDGATFISYSRSAGDTYISIPEIDQIVGSIGSTPESNEIIEEGELPNTFPVVRWATYRAKGDGGQSIKCVAITRSGEAASMAAGGAYTSAMIVATECRGPTADLDEQDAAILSGSIRTR